MNSHGGSVGASLIGSHTANKIPPNLCYPLDPLQQQHQQQNHHQSQQQRLPQQQHQQQRQTNYNNFGKFFHFQKIWTFFFFKPNESGKLCNEIAQQDIVSLKRGSENLFC